MLTTPENIAAKTIVCTEFGGSIPRVTSSQKVSHSRSNVCRWTIWHIGWTHVKYCLISRSAAKRDGRKSIREAWDPVPPKKNPDVGKMYWGPAFSHSDAGGSGMAMSGGATALPSSILLSPVIYVSCIVYSSWDKWLAKLTCVSLSWMNEKFN